MRSFIRFLLFTLPFLTACRKNSNTYQRLSVTGLGSIAFATGDAISVYGTGFDTIPGNNIVTFNGVPGEVATAKPNRLQVIVPALAENGKVSVQVHGQTGVSPQDFSIANVLQGNYTDNVVLDPRKKYLLRGQVIFNSKLIVNAGCVIYGEKLTHAGLAAQDIDFEGTPDKPIVFTSDQAPGSRQPGDWSGITTTASGDPNNVDEFVPLGIAQYVRVEYAGFHQPGRSGQALSLATDPSSVFKYIQVSYSASDGLVLTGNSPNCYVEHLIALACGGNDFFFNGGGIAAQYGLGIKDPYYGDELQGNGIVVGSVKSPAGPDQVSNFTMIGYNPAARNLAGPAGLPLTQSAGRPVLVGINSDVNGAGGSTSDYFALYNSVIAGGWKAGVSLYGPGTYYYRANWGNYEDSTSGGNDVTVRNNYFVATAPALLPFRGGVFAREDYATRNGFEDIFTTPQFALFGVYNDTTRQLDLVQGKDDLGLRGIADYQNLNHPVILPAAGSPLLHGAFFPAGTPAASPQFNKDLAYIGAFGTIDWTSGWSNFDPQQTNY